MLWDEDHQEWVRLAVMSWPMGLIDAPINQNITSWAIEVYICAIVLTIRLSSTSWELHQLVDEEGCVTRVS